MKNRGFISFIALVVFINVTFILASISNKCLKGLKVLENMNESTKFLNEEKKTLSIIKEYLKSNKEYKDDIIELEIVKEDENELIVVISDFYYVIKYEDNEIVDFYIIQ